MLIAHNILDDRMSQSVLPYVRGIDFRNNEFGAGDFPNKSEKLTGIRWLNLDKTGIKYS